METPNNEKPQTFEEFCKLPENEIYQPKKLLTFEEWFQLSDEERDKLLSDALQERKELRDKLSEMIFKKIDEE